MAETSGIEWTDATANFWWGCSKVSLACDNCYAETWAKRVGFGDIWGVGAPRRRIKGAEKLILKLHNDYSWFYADHDRRRRVFIQSMSDLFDTEVPLEWFADGWRLIKACDRLVIQIVTKRVTVIEKRLAVIGEQAWPQHAGLIISVINQDEADRDVPRLIALKVKMGIPWVGLSMEPLLGAVTLRPEWLAALDWVIVGGESGRHARPLHPDWVIGLRDQCEVAKIAFLFKQWGEHLPVHVDTVTHTGIEFRRVGKAAAGRRLHGLTHDGFPSKEMMA